MKFEFIFIHALLRSNVALSREHFALLTLNVEMLKFMDCILDFEIRIYLHTCPVKVKCCSVKGKLCTVNVKCMDCVLDFVNRIYLCKCPVKFTCCFLKRKFCTVNVKCGDAKIYGLRLGFCKSNLSLHMPCSGQMLLC